MKNPKTLKHSLTREQTKLERRAKRLYALAACFLLAVTALAVPALAADDPLAVVQKLSDFIFSLIRAVGCPLAVTSANLSGAPAAAVPELLDGDLVSRTAGVLEGPCGASGGGLASTVIDCTTVKPSVLRCGPVSSRDIEECSHD